MTIKAAGEGKDQKAEGDDIPQSFDDAFDEAIEEDKGRDEKPIDDDDDLKDEAKKEEPTPDKSEEEKAAEEELEKKPDVDPEIDPAKEEPVPDDDKDVKTIDEVQHQYKTVSGMFNSEVKKNQKLQDELALLKEGKQPKPEEEDLEKPKEEDPELDVATLAKTIGESESFKKLGDEYGEEMTTALTDMAGNIAKTVIGTLSKEVDGKLNEFSGRIDPLQADYAKNADQTHFSALKTAHPDYEKHRDSGEMEEWIEIQPAYKKKMYLDVFKKGGTEDIIDLFSTFKDAKGYSEAPPEKEEEKEKPEVEIDKKKLEDMEVIDKKNSPVSGVKGSAAKDDFEVAWEEA